MVEVLLDLRLVQLLQDAGLEVRADLAKSVWARLRFWASICLLRGLLHQVWQEQRPDVRGHRAGRGARGQMTKTREPANGWRRSRSVLPRGPLM